MSKRIKNALLCFGMCFFMNHILRILGDTALQAFIYSSVPSILISISVGLAEE